MDNVMFMEVFQRKAYLCKPIPN